MNDFTIEDAAQLISYYKQRVSDLEYQVLQLQLQLSKAAAHTHDSADSVKENAKASYKNKIEK